MNAHHGKEVALGEQIVNQTAYVHHSSPHIPNRNHTLLLALGLLREERKRLADLGLLLRGDVVLARELGQLGLLALALGALRCA